MAITASGNIDCRPSLCRAVTAGVVETEFVHSLEVEANRYR
jgi:hypothetical protein